MGKEIQCTEAKVKLVSDFSLVYLKLCPQLEVREQS